MTLGERIKEIRKDNKLTQKEFADKISVSRPFISRIEADKEKPSESLMKLISATFGIELDWIAQGTGYKESQLKTTNKILQNVDVLSLDGLDQIDFAECASLLAHILTVHTKRNSEQYFKNSIHSILSVLNSFFNRPDVTEYEKEDIEVIVTYIEKKLKEAVETFKKEDLNEKITF